MNTFQEQNVTRKDKLTTYPTHKETVNLDLRAVNQITTMKNLEEDGLNWQAYYHTLPNADREGIDRMSKWIKIEGIDKVKRTIQRLMTIEGEV